MKSSKMLLASDLSGESLRPFATAIAWAEELGMQVTLLHVVEEVLISPPEGPLPPATLALPLGDRLARARELLEKEAERLTSATPLVLDVVAANDVARTIAAYAAEHGFTLIALSTHGRSGFRRVVMGSVAENVIRHAHMPVLVFPPAG